MGNLFEKELEKKTIFKDRNAISQHYFPKELPFREKQIQEMTKILTPSLQGKKPDNLFLYGKVGTGKTTVTFHVIKELEEFVKKNQAKVTTNYVNCRNHNSKYKVLIKAIKKFFPEENFIGYSAGFIQEKFIDYCNKENHIILVLDEIDKVKDLDELVYSLSRSNDEIQNGSISIIGISNNLMFKERLDPRTKSSLCEKEMVFPPYNAEELRAILKARVELAFIPGSVSDSAVNLAAAIAAQESGDARTAVMLLMRAGEIAENTNARKVSDVEVNKAKKKVEEDIIFNMVSTLPEQQQLVLKAIALLSMSTKGIKKITGQEEIGVLYSGEIYDKYKQLASGIKESVVSSRWYRQYITELEMYGLILTSASGPGIKGQTKLIKLGFDAEKINSIIDSQLGK
ncbi:AAA family ATPase [Candidatus Micrarchaeota archaeon]|nr:AAA family ATPase [Candidatus Micrarchaeota archaeon]